MPLAASCHATKKWRKTLEAIAVRFGPYTYLLHSLTFMHVCVPERSIGQPVRLYPPCTTEGSFSRVSTEVGPYLVFLPSLLHLSGLYRFCAKELINLTLRLPGPMLDLILITGNLCTCGRTVFVETLSIYVLQKLVLSLLLSLRLCVCVCV